MQCTSMYPCNDDDVNLNVIDNLKKSFNLNIGYSHHSFGDLALYVAFMKGAKIFEFHFTDDRKGKLLETIKFLLMEKR